MKFSAASAFLLSTAALASPILEARQVFQRAKFLEDGFSTQSEPGSQACRFASVNYTHGNEVATVILPNDVVALGLGFPAPLPKETSCFMTLKVRFAGGQCTKGTAQ